MKYFGDSLTAAESAQVEPGRIYYPWLVSMLRGEEPPTVFAKAGHLAADQAAAIYNSVPGESSLLIGTNDRLTYHGAGVGLFQNILSAESYWLSGAMLAARRPGWTFTGTWANYVSSHPWAAVGRYTNSPGATASATFDGDVLLVGYTMIDGGACGSMSVQVDGVVVGTINCAPPRVISGGVGHSPYAPGVFRASGFGPGTHTVLLTSNSAGYALIDWVGGPPASRLWLLTLPFTANGDDAEVIAYNCAISQVAVQCAADGYPVSVIGVGSVVRLNELCANSSFTNNYHPNNHGNLNMAAKIVAARS